LPGGREIDNQGGRGEVMRGANFPFSLFRRGRKGGGSIYPGAPGGYQDFYDLEEARSGPFYLKGKGERGNSRGGKKICLLRQKKTGLGSKGEGGSYLSQGKGKSPPFHPLLRGKNSGRHEDLYHGTIRERRVVVPFSPNGEAFPFFWRREADIS